MTRWIIIFLLLCGGYVLFVGSFSLSEALAAIPAVLFMALQAPDVAFAEITVGAAAVPLLFLVVLASMKMDPSPRAPDEP